MLREGTQAVPKVPADHDKVKPLEPRNVCT